MSKTSVSPSRVRRYLVAGALWSVACLATDLGAQQRTTVLDRAAQERDRAAAAARPSAPAPAPCHGERGRRRRSGQARAPLEHTHVEMPDENAGLGAGEHHGAHFGFFRTIERGRQLADELARQRVAIGRRVERDGGHARLDGAVHEFPHVGDCRRGATTRRRLAIRS
mgnify:CR=1 FL=1